MLSAVFWNIFNPEFVSEILYNFLIGPEAHGCKYLSWRIIVRNTHGFMYKFRARDIYLQRDSEGNGWGLN